MKRENERRSYYRIDDVIGLTYSKLDSAGGDRANSGKKPSTPLANLFVEIDQEFNQATNTLWHENPTMAQALGLLNRKISLLAAHSLAGKDSSNGSYEELRVNISGSGLAFGAIEELPPGSKLNLFLVLKPSDISITLTSTVVGCDKAPFDSNQPYWVRVSIGDNNSAAQEQLIQHVVQKQCTLIEPSSAPKKP